MEESFVSIPGKRAGPERVAHPLTRSERRAAVSGCRRCPRLVAWIDAQKQQSPDHHNAPVVDRGPVSARLMLVGLAPGRLGANKTGRAFVGDSSSDFLFQALHATGFASSVNPSSARLQGVRITNVVKCLPPQNQPTREEEQNCSDHLRAELAEFWSPRVRAPRVLVSLGGVAHRALWRSLPEEHTNRLKCPAFSHNARTPLAANLFLVSSFHPSKLNTQTGRLTQGMLQDVLRLARQTLGER